MKRLFIILLAFSLLLGVSGDVVEADDPEVELTIAGAAVGDEMKWTEKAAEIYEERNPEVEVTIHSTPDETDERRSLYLQYFEAESDEIDVYQIDVMWPGDMAEHLLDLYEYGAEEYVDDHIQGIVENNGSSLFSVGK